MFKFFSVVWLGATLAAASIGCATRHRMEPVDLTTPGWTQLAGQAVWIRPPNLELAGDLVVGYSNETSVVQFTKGQFAVVNARRSGGRWETEFFSQRKFSGRGQPPSRIPWLHLAEAARTGVTPKGWTWTRSESGWKLENVKSGESIEGFFADE